MQYNIIIFQTDESADQSPVKTPSAHVSLQVAALQVRLLTAFLAGKYR